MRSPSAWRGLILMLFLPLGWVDHLAGPHIDITFGYMILIVLATINLGLGGAMASVVLAEIAAVAAKWAWVGSTIPQGGFALDMALRLAAFVTVAALVNTVVAERENIERHSVTDKLTGLFNRRRFDEALAEEALRSERYRHPLALVLIDVDHFKRYNDRHGHVRGDGVLRQVGRVLVRAKRVTDMAFRYGGEEFCLLLPETGLTEAKEVAERVRRTIQEESFIGEHTQPGARLTCSLGVAMLAPGEDPRELVKRADSALYEAKQRGRNRVEVAEGVSGRRDVVGLRRAGTTI